MKKAKLKFGSSSEEYSDSVDEGDVISQSIAAKKTVDKNSKVNLVVSKGPEPEPDTDLTETEKEGLIWALQSVCYHIEKKNLSSPAGIRASFKTAVMQKILTETKAVSKTLDDWSTRTDWSSSASIKKSFEAFLVEMGRPWKGADETFASIDLTGLGLESESPAPKVKTTCPTGTCPPVRYYY